MALDRAAPWNAGRRGMNVAKDVDLCRPNSQARDYSLTGDSAKHAIEAGLVAAEWYHTDVPRTVLKQLMRRRDGPAMRDTALWIVLHLLFATGGIYFWGSWVAVPFWLAYGVIYGSACDSRWHECGHGTAFRTRWMNDVVYQVASFQVMRNPVNWRWSHARHHTDTIIVGRDVEISWVLPIQLGRKVLAYFGVVEVWKSLRVLIRNSLGYLSPDEMNYIPESKWPKAIFWARIHVLIYAATTLVALGMMFTGMGLKSTIPFLLIGGPRAYGCWHMVMTGLLQHGGLAENVLDHRLNSRTFYLNPIGRWIYWNMNYHVEHHMFPMVPYYSIQKLHEIIKHDLPKPNPSLFAANKEMILAVMRQRREPGYFVRKELPPTAKPYLEALHKTVPERTIG